MPVLGSTAYSSARGITSQVRSLLNDAANLLSVPVNIANITRNTATGVVTVSCQLPHNMVGGDSTLISGVPTGTSNFNGTFPVATILDMFQFTYTQAGVNDTQASGQVQGFGIGAIYTDSVLIPFVNAIYQKLVRKLGNTAEGTFISDNNLLVVPAIVGNPDAAIQVVINDSTAPPNQLPIDLLQPLKLWERPNGSTDDFFEMVDLTDGGGLPPEIQGQTLEVWEWRGDGIYFVGATQDTQIRLRYLKGFSDLVDGSSSTLLRNMREAVAFGTAAIAGMSRGSQLAEKYETAAQDSTEDLLNTSARALQHRNFRMRSFTRRKGYTPF